MKIQQAHPHPRFNAAGTKVVFTSDWTGYCQVYEAEGPEFRGCRRRSRRAREPTEGEQHVANETCRVAAALAAAWIGGPATGGAEAGAGMTFGPGDLCLLVGERASLVERRAADLFAAEVRRRTALDVPVGSVARAKHALVAGTAASGDEASAFAEQRPEVAKLGPDGYCLATTPDANGRLHIVGQSPSGVVAGLGKLLRLARYAERAVVVPAVTLTDTPQLPVRGIYFATHFGNFYHVAPLDEVDRVIEDFALWGGNSLTVWFDMHHFSGFDDPAAQAHVGRLKHFGETARGLGMQFGLAFLANEAYNTSPEPLRAKWLPGWPHYHVELCPSKPEGLALTGKWQAQILSAFPNVDFIWTWPYDQGGCACDQCKPWGANGFLRASEQLARLYHERFPEGKVWLSTWLFDSLSGAQGEYAGLLRYLREQKPNWLGGILGGTHGDALPKVLDERPDPERYPLTCFPEISMYQMSPWGGCGANPLPGFCGRLMDNLRERTPFVRGRIQGGWPYSEGIYEDLNKFLWSQFFWSPGRPTEDMLAEYASYYLCPEATADAVRLFHLLEETHPRTNWRVRNLAQAEEAWALAEALDARLPTWAKASWRWRLLYVRAAIDHVLKSNRHVTAEARSALQPLCDELVRLYHAQNTFIRPAPLPTPKDTANLALDHPVRVSSTHPECADSERMLTNGILAQDDPQDFWVHDPSKEKTAWVVVDLGESKAIKEVRLQFRGLYGQFWFVPSSLAFEVSDDGERFQQVMTSQAVPKEGSEYSPDLRTCEIGMKGRYLRLTLGASQHVAPPYPGALELTEVEVYGP